MPPLTREQLDARRSSRRRRALRRDRRAIVSAAIPIIIVGVLALVLGITGGEDDSTPLASPVASPEIGPGARPPELVVARAEGYEVTITPSTAAAGLTLRISHLDEPASGPRPSVGTPVRAGETEIGRVRDFSEVAGQELSEFTADEGNHVDIELVRGEAAQIL